jgi:hypothetical protein
MAQTIMEKADAILAQCGLSTPGNNSGVPSSPTEHTVGLNRQPQKMAPVTEAQANALLEATGIQTSEKEETGETEGRTSGRTVKRRRKAKRSNEPLEKSEKSSAEEEEERAAEEEVQEEGSGGVKRLQRKGKGLDKQLAKTEAGRWSEDPNVRAKANAEADNIQGQSNTNSFKVGRKTQDGENRNWTPGSSKVENLGTTVGSLGTNFAGPAKKRGRNLKKTKLKENKSFAAFINEVFKNV